MGKVLIVIPSWMHRTIGRVRDSFQAIKSQNKELLGDIELTNSWDVAFTHAAGPVSIVIGLPDYDNDKEVSDEIDMQSRVCALKLKVGKAPVFTCTADTPRRHFADGVIDLRTVPIGEIANLISDASQGLGFPALFKNRRWIRKRPKPKAAKANVQARTAQVA